MHTADPIRILYTAGPLEFWLYTTNAHDQIIGPAVFEDGHRIGQLVVRLTVGHLEILPL